MRIVLITGFYPGAKMGGAEYQTALLARGLTKLGHEAIFIAVRAPQEATFEHEGVQVHELTGWRAMGRATYKKALEQLLTEIKPDLCYVRLLTELADVSALCRREQIPVVSVTCSLRETTPFLFGYHPRETIGYLRSQQTYHHLRSFWAIRHSAAHICNTHELRERMQPWLPGKQIQTIYNGSMVAPETEIHSEPTGQIIWVNNFKNGKRPHLFVELARRLPQYKFVMVGAIANRGRYARWLRNMLAKAPANLQHLGALPIEQTNEQISQSDLLVYTSKAGVEGFGNSFLQAWFRGVPTASLSFELDGILDREGVGFFAKSFDELVQKTESLMQDRSARARMGQRALDYALENYRAETMVAAHEKLFQAVTDQSSSRQVTHSYAS